MNILKPTSKYLFSYDFELSSKLVSIIIITLFVIITINNTIIIY